MNAYSEDEIGILKNENKLLKGKIRGYQRLGQLFQEVKEKNRLLEMERQNKEMVSVSTETGPPGPKDFPFDPFTDQLHSNGITDLKDRQQEVSMGVPSIEKKHSVNLIPTSMGSTIDGSNDVSNISVPIENSGKPEETNFILRQKLEDALHLVGEFERKRSNDKKLVKILNEEVKKSKDEVKIYQEKFQYLQQEKDLMLKKISRLERERDNFPLKAGGATAPSAEEGAEDWVHLHKEAISGQADEFENDYQHLRNKCKELEEKASRWENEHFNLQMESSKHVNDLRSLLESKSKELIKVSERFNSEKKILETKFKKLEAELKNETDSKFEAYSMHQETMRKYRILEKKFLVLEEKKKNPSMERMEPTEKDLFQIPAVSGNHDELQMLKQQITIFKEDFENERKERLIAERQSKTFEEKLHNISRQLEKKDQELSKHQKFLRDETAKNEKLLEKIHKLEADNKCVLDHNRMLMELQSKMTVKTKETLPTPLSHATRELNTEIYPTLWTCKICTYINDPQAENCGMCKGRKPSSRERSSPRFTPRWKCHCCTYENNPKSESCSICKAPKPLPDVDEPDRMKRRISRPMESVTSNPYDDDLTIDGPTTEILKE